MICIVFCGPFQTAAGRIKNRESSEFEPPLERAERERKRKKEAHANNHRPIVPSFPYTVSHPHNDC